METAQSTVLARQAQIAASELDAALSEGEIEVFLLSLQKVIRARGGFAEFARKAALKSYGVVQDCLIGRKSDAQHLDRPVTSCGLAALSETAQRLRVRGRTLCRNRVS